LNYWSNLSYEIDSLNKLDKVIEYALSRGIYNSVSLHNFQKNPLKNKGVK
jgi:aryl-phospho-beta-D-glucosidase BglC (GH1 family)